MMRHELIRDVNDAITREYDARLALVHAVSEREAAERRLREYEADRLAEELEAEREAEKDWGRL